MKNLDIDFLFQKAVELHFKNRLSEADSLYREILKTDPNHKCANRNLKLISLSNLKARVQLPSLDLGAPNTTEKPMIRILHNMARSGGTIISRCLGCMKDVILLSEIHPFAKRVASQFGNQFDPLHQAQAWFDLFSQDEVIELQNSNLSYAQTIKLIHDRVQAQNKILVLRDWTHLDFTGVPFITKPTYSFNQVAFLQDDFQILNTAIVRHPIDQWLSLDKLSIVHGKIDIKEFLHGYLEFSRRAVKTGFIRY